MNLAVSSGEQNSCLRENFHDYLEREARRAPQGERIAQRKIPEAETERERILGNEETLTGRRCIGQIWIATMKVTS